MARPSKSAQLDPIDLTACLDNIVHLDVVQRAVMNGPDPQELRVLADFFAAISDPTRLRIVSALLHGDMCVCDISAAIGASESATSHHLRLLRDRGLVRSRREGRMAYYVLDDDHVRRMIEQGRDHAAHRIDRSP